MISVDTNVLVRFITNDEPRQAKRARALIEGHDILVTATVLLECEWVLRAGYGFTADKIVRAFRSVLGLPRMHIEAADKIEKALEWCASGLDFADALHTAFSGSADKFATFDDKLVRRAKKIPELSVQAV
jgi:predicted nucleic-acid-binding protein